LRRTLRTGVRILVKCVSERIVQGAENKLSAPMGFEFYDLNDELADLIYLPLQSVDWQLVLQIPRDESIGFLRTIKIK